MVDAWVISDGLWSSVGLRFGLSVEYLKAAPLPPTPVWPEALDVPASSLQSRAKYVWEARLDQELSKRSPGSPKMKPRWAPEESKNNRDCPKMGPQSSLGTPRWALGGLQNRLPEGPNRSPRGPKWRRREGRSETASGRLLRPSWRLLGSSWAALSASWDPLCRPGESPEARGGAPGGHFGTYF